MAIFDRDPGESKPAWLAFKWYRDFGAARTTDTAWRARYKIAGEFRRAPRHWYLWSSDHSWVKRAEAYDAHLDKIAEKAHEKRIIALAQRKADNAFIIQDRLEELANWERAWVEKHNALPASDVDQTVKKAERGSVTITRTKIKGLRSSAARIAQDYKDTLEKMGPARDKNTQTSSPKSVIPDWLAEALRQPETPAAEEPGDSGGADSIQ